MSKRVSLWENGISPSFVAQWLRCKGTTYLKYVERWRSSRTSTSLQFGSACHYVLEKAYAKKKPPTAKKIKKWLQQYQVSEGRDKLFQEPAYQMAMGAANIVMQAYFKFYLTDFDSEIKWLCLEGKYRVPHVFDDGTIVDLQGIKDGVYTRDGKKVVFDTKCKGRFNVEDIFDGFPMNFQFNTYAWVDYLESGKCADGIECNIIRIPQIKQGNQNLAAFLDRLSEDVASRPSFYFARPYYPLTKAELLHWVSRQLKPIMEDIRRWVENGYQPRYYDETGLTVGYRKSDFHDAICNDDYTQLVQGK